MNFCWSTWINLLVFSVSDPFSPKLALLPLWPLLLRFLLSNRWTKWELERQWLIYCFTSWLSCWGIIESWPQCLFSWNCGWVLIQLILYNFCVYKCIVREFFIQIFRFVRIFNEFVTELTIFHDVPFAQFQPDWDFFCKKKSPLWFLICLTSVIGICVDVSEWNLVILAFYFLNILYT